MERALQKALTTLYHASVNYNIIEYYIWDDSVEGIQLVWTNSLKVTIVYNKKLDINYQYMDC